MGHRSFNWQPRRKAAALILSKSSYLKDTVYSQCCKLSAVTAYYFSLPLLLNFLFSDLSSWFSILFLSPFCLQRQDDTRKSVSFNSNSAIIQTELYLLNISSSEKRPTEFVLSFFFKGLSVSLLIQIFKKQILVLINVELFLHLYNRTNIKLT